MILATDKFKEMFSNMSENYDVLINYHLTNRPLAHLKGSEEGVCRFCGKRFPEVKFKTKAHAIPELVGNKVLFSDYECDTCNALFSKFEDQFSNFMLLIHTLTQVHGKGGVPTYKPRSDQYSRIDANEKIDIKVYEGDEPMCDFDKDGKTITFKGKHSYVPQMMHKCLTKMALTIMPEEEVENFAYTLKWLQGDISPEMAKNLKCFYRFYPGQQSFTGVSCFLYKRKDESKNVPYCMFLLMYGNIAFQIYIPFCEKDKILHGKNMLMHVFPTPLDYYSGIAKPKLLDLSSNEKVKNTPISLSFSFEKVIEVHLDSKDIPMNTK